MKVELYQIIFKMAIRGMYHGWGNLFAITGRMNWALPLAGSKIN